MSIVGYVNIALEVFGSFLSLMVILFLVYSRRRKTELERLYITILSFNTCMQLSDAVAWLFEGTPGKTVGVIVHTVNFVTFVTSYLLMAVFVQYLVKYIACKNKSITKAAVYTAWGIAGTAILLVIVSQFNDMIYLIDAQNHYVIQHYYWISQLLGIAGMLTGAVVLIKYRKSLQGLEATLFFLYDAMPVAAMIFQIFFPGIEMLYAANNLSILCIYIFIQAEQTRMLSEKELELERSKTALMLSQIQPHFLYNTLTSIGYLCETDPTRAGKAIIDFSKFLRGNMNSINSVAPIPFEQELDHLNHYLAVEKLRFPDTLAVEMDIQATDFLLPSLTLQPIVENAVRHGVGAKKQGGTIKIATWQTDGGHLISVSDDGKGFPTESQNAHDGIGLNNVRARMRLLCGGNLAVKSESGVGTTVTLIIPKEGKRI